MTKTLKINLILFISALCNIFVLGTTFYDAHSLKQAQAELSQTINHNTELLIKLHELERTVGYSGFIHHFKNYVIREKQQYYLDAQVSYTKAVLLIEDISQFSKDEEVIESLNVLKATLIEYNFNMETHFANSGQLTVSELDKLVKVDDSFASEAVNNIVEQVLPKVRVVNQKFLQDIEMQLVYSYSFSVLICVAIIAFTSLIVWYINKLNMSVDKFSKLFDATPDGIIHADNQGNILAANKAAQTLFGYSQSEFNTKRIEDLMAHSLNKVHKKYRKEFTNRTQSKNMMDRRSVMGVDKYQQEIPLQIAIGSFAANDEFQSISIIRDMREITLLNQELAFFTNILKGLSSFVAIINEKGDVITANYALHEGEISPNLFNTSVWLSDKPTFKRLKNALNKLTETGEEQHFDGQIEVLGEKIAVDVVIARLNDNSDTTSTFICSAHDISERKSFEQQLLENQEKFKLVVNHVSEGIILFKKDGRIDWLNAKAIDMLAPYTHGQSPCNFIEVFAKQDQQEISKQVDELTIHNATTKPFQALLQHNEHALPVELRITRYVDNLEVNYLATVSDVSKLLAANDSLSTMLEEKSMLLNEIHHRVKNNLQVIMSLLKLQQQHVPESAGAELLACQQRIRSVALVHQLLYEQEDSSKINAVEYISKLAQLILLDGINHVPYKVELALPTTPTFLPINMMIPIGFVINEILTNIQKHAFPNKNEGGLVTISANVSENELVLSIKDNGVGFELTEFDNANSLGHTLIHLFTKQANGEIEVESEIGGFSHFQFKFDLSHVH
ncbi:histidine kinase dimerization/phosphoacceptor domain -containing protein [Pseudoalteromonas sp. SSM20]|uniref:histidine kinase dimerization/phosphoacceptor domain -containing protein n=1 Tax=Pseudoalteromonas sp. SSM20 TaxID=3139394 RepID=UPI003BA8BDB2